jgi:pyruvate kinase
MPTYETFHNQVRTKIVATVGPACADATMLAQLIEAGVDVFRVNMAHGDRAEHERVVTEINRLSAEAGRPIGILVDLAGPKIRLGELLASPTDCDAGAEFHFIRGDKPASAHELVSTYKPLVDELVVGNRVMLADGTVAMQVVEKTDGRARCEVVGAGQIRSRQGINLPGVKLSVPAMTDADWENADWATDRQIDFLGLSFVRSQDDILQLKDRVRSRGSAALIIAKIEKSEALDHLEEIVSAADGVMVARGDLGVEIDVAETPVAQKRIISLCQKLRKPVIVATQMLDSMQNSRRPTRAEATDVANAILDGADACMLSGETAIGQYPLESVEMMNRIMKATEAILVDTTEDSSPPASDVHPITSAIVYGAGRIAQRLAARMVVIATRSGATARIKAKQRDVIPTIGVSQSEATLRQMCLYWGITPLPGATFDHSSKLNRFIADWGRRNGTLSPGDRVVFVTGTGVVRGVNNLLVVYEVD